MKRLVDECPKAKQVLYYENIEGGHGGAADNKQRACELTSNLPPTLCTNDGFSIDIQCKIMIFTACGS